MFIRTEVLRIKWQSFQAKCIINQNILMKSNFSNICVAIYQLMQDIHAKLNPVLLRQKQHSKVRPFTASTGEGNCNMLHLEHIFVRC
jgi:hypothetical protein